MTSCLANRACARFAACAFLWIALAAAAAASENYLIVTAEDYAGSPPLTQFIDAKAAQGFNVAVYTVPVGTHRTEIKQHIESLWDTPDAPDYLLIVGDTDGATAGPATIPHWVGQGSRQATTDLPYVCMDGPDDWVPDIYAGRFSVRDVATLQAVVDKSLFVEAGNFANPDYTRRAVFLATDDETAQAEQTHDWVIGSYLVPSEFQAARVYANQGGNTWDVANAVNNGALFTVYFGHSSSSGWWAPSFTQTEVENLTNDGLYGLVMGWSCNTAHYDYPECFGETWLRQPNAGAAAYLSASNYVWWGSVEAWESSRRMEKYFFQSFFSDYIWRVGPAWRAALQRIYDDPDFGPTHDHTRNIFEEFILLGDPALQLPEPDSFTFALDPQNASTCAAQTSEVTFAIDVGLVGGFAEPVHLEATGTPAGTTVTFSENDLPPPFSSVLTVGNLTPDTAGQYGIHVSAATPSLTRDRYIMLRVAADAPTAPAPLDPPTGALNVPVALQLQWSASAGAREYEIEVATDPEFNALVATGTPASTRFDLANLDSLTRYYWRVKARNACGASDFSATSWFTTLDTDVTLSAFVPTSYNMANGEQHGGDFFDDTYDGSGNNTVPLSYLSGGLGDLTDGVRATDHCYLEPAPYVGWKVLDPLITFNFPLPINFGRVKLHFDDGHAGNQVFPPNTVRLFVGGASRSYWVNDPPGNEPFDATLEDVDLAGKSMVVQLIDENPYRALMVSEIEFFGTLMYGNLNCEGSISQDDIDAFVLALTDPDGYAAAYPNCDRILADCNGDGVVNAGDIDLFIWLLENN